MISPTLKRTKCGHFLVRHSNVGPSFCLPVRSRKYPSLFFGATYAADGARPRYSRSPTPPPPIHHHCPLLPQRRLGHLRQRLRLCSRQQPPPPASPPTATGRLRLRPRQQPPRPPPRLPWLVPAGLPARTTLEHCRHQIPAVLAPNGFGSPRAAVCGTSVCLHPLQKS